MLILLMQALALGIVIVLAGYRLTRIGDELAERTGFGESLVGFVLLAAVTSLPELSTAVSAAVIEQSDLVMGNIFGSNIFNLLIIGFLVLTLGRRKLVDGDEKNVFTGTLGVALGAVAGLGLLSGFEWTGECLLVAYIFIMWLNYRFEQKHLSTDTKPSFQFCVLWRLYFQFVALGAVVVVTGYLMTTVSDRIAVTPISLGAASFVLGRTFIGQLILAISTSLPELIVTISAMKLGRINMAYANIYGSNIFNLAILGISGSIFNGNLFTAAGPQNLFSLLVFMLMAAISLGALNYRSTRKLRLDGVMIILLFLLNMAYVFSR